MRWEPWERRLETRWLRPPARRRPSWEKPPGCKKHMVILDALGRCPICCDLGIVPEWARPGPAAAP